MTVRRTVSVAAALVAVATFVLLYRGLVDLAVLAGLTDFRAWLYPLAVDGMVAAGYAATLVLRGRHLAFAWFVVGVGSVLSLVGQWLHAEAASSWRFAGPVAAVPALSMALVWHLLWVVSLRREEAPEEPVEAEAPLTFGTAMHEAVLGFDDGIRWGEPSLPSLADKDVALDEIMDLLGPASVPVSAPRPMASTAVLDRPKVVRDTDRLAEAVSVLRSARDAGEQMTGAAMAHALQLPNAGTESGRRNGLRWLRKAEEALG